MKKIVSILLLAGTLGACHSGAKGSHTTADLEARVEVLEQKLNEQQKFFDTAKEVMSSHRARITVNQRMMEVLKKPRYQAKMPSSVPGGK